MDENRYKKPLYSIIVEGWMGEYYEGGEERWEKIG